MKIRNRTGHKIDSQEWIEIEPGTEVTRDMNGGVYLSLWNEQVQLTQTQANALAAKLWRNVISQHEPTTKEEG